jgi:hypothetical protein
LLNQLSTIGGSLQLENGGKIKLIAGAILNCDDVIAIRDGLEKPFEVIQRNFIEDINDIGNEFERNHVQALGWMVANNKLLYFPSF